MDRFIDIAGRNIWTRVVGDGPAVVLCSGAGAAAVGQWQEVEERAAQSVTVVTYDRTGTGRSDSPERPPTALDMADELGSVLDTLAIDRPVVLVGFSMSAFLVQLYAFRHRGEVAGLILLDPLPDEFLAKLADQPSGVRASLRATTAQMSGASPALLLETEKSIESAVQVRDAVATGGFLDVPLIVVAVEHPEPSGLAKSHAALARRSSRGRLLLVNGSSHQTFRRDQCDTIVRLIREMCPDPN